MCATMKRWLLFAGGIILWTSLRWGEGSPPRRGGIYHYTLGPSDPPSLDPAHITDTVSHAVASELYDGLVTFDEDLRIQPAIAARWVVSADGRTYTFHLRPGVRFHNGRAVTGEDFRYSFERLLHPETRSERTWILEKLRGAREFMAGKARRVAGIEVRGPHTLQLTLERPFAPFLALLAYPAASVLPREAIERWGRQFSTHPMGTGPFQFREWRHDDRVVLEAHPDYFQGAPYLDGIVFRVIPDEMTRFQEFQAGNLDHTDIPTGLFRMVQNDRSLGRMLVSRPSLGINAIQFNLERPPFRENRALRQAFNYAVDKEAIAKVILEGRVMPARSILPPGMMGHDPELQGYPHNREKARRLLAEAGYEGGRGLPTLTLHYNTGLLNRKVAEFVQGMLREIGVTVELRELDWPAYLNLVDRGDAALFRLGWLADYPDPENFLTVLFHSRNKGSNGNLSRYANGRVDALLDRADGSLDSAERSRLYREAERMILEDAPWIFLHYYSTDVLIQPWVRGLREQISAMDSAPALGLVQMRKVWVEK
jgi:peptide/nickel transport system substrate-binding protein/oligopeptide transport system substrate-binding protein